MLNYKFLKRKPEFFKILIFRYVVIPCYKLILKEAVKTKQKTNGEY